MDLIVIFLTFLLALGSFIILASALFLLADYRISVLIKFLGLRLGIVSLNFTEDEDEHH